MSFMNAMKKLGIVEDEQPKEVKKVPQQSLKANTAIEAEALLSGTTGSTLDIQAVEQHIEQAIHSHPEFQPMVTFLTMADSMSSAIPDEGMRLKAAAAASGAKGTALANAANASAMIIGVETQRFDEQFVAEAQSHIVALNGQATDVQTQIDELTVKLGQLAEQKKDLADQIRSAEVDLEKAKIDFKSVVSKISAKYSELVTKITQHVGA